MKVRTLTKLGIYCLVTIGLILCCTELRFDNPYETGGNDPAIKLFGSTSITLIINEKYVESGFEATDNDGKDLTNKVEVSVKDKDDKTVDVDSFTEKIGNYKVKYKVKNENGFTANAERSVLVKGIVDSIPPVITILGKNPAELYQFQTYSDAGATANDNINGDLTPDIKVTNNVESDTVGSYKVIYTVEDTAGNTDTKERIVNVLVIPDTTPPVITLIGNDTVRVNYKGFYIDAGATALDDKDGSFQPTRHGYEDINTDSLGATFIIFWTASDRAGNEADTVRRYVIIADLEPPVIYLNPPINVTLGVGYPYVEYGAYAIDVVDDTILFSDSVFTVDNRVDTSKAGVYDVIYDVSDAAGNKAVSKTRKVTVVETIKEP